MVMVVDIGELVKATRAAHEAHEKSKRAAREVAARVQAETGYGRPAQGDAGPATPAGDGAAS